jgi:hypothetical protein
MLDSWVVGRIVVKFALMAVHCQFPQMLAFLNRAPLLSPFSEHFIPVGSLDVRIRGLPLH